MSFMYVKIYHGPCNTFHTCIHKPHLLTGLKGRLQKLGFRVDLVAVKFIDYCMIEMCGHEIFRCNIKHLKFNTYPERDPVCLRAIEAAMTSAVKFRRGRAYLWFGTLINHELFRRTHFAPKDYWPVDVDFTPIATVKDCWDCCQLELQKYPKVEDKSGTYKLEEDGLVSPEKSALDDGCANEIDLVDRELELS